MATSKKTEVIHIDLSSMTTVPGMSVSGMGGGASKMGKDTKSGKAGKGGPKDNKTSTAKKGGPTPASPPRGGKGKP